MKKLFSTLCATALTASVAATSVLPASAAPVFVPKTPAVHSDVIQIKNKWKKRHGNNHNFRGKNWNGNGHNNHHHGGDNNNDWWYPAGAFVAGALIGSAVANNNRYYNSDYSGGSGHVQWCYDRYRSYREYDNTFQPYNGPRQQCYSPYN